MAQRRSFADFMVDSFGDAVDAQAARGRAGLSRAILMSGFRVVRAQTSHFPEKARPRWGQLAAKVALRDMVGPLEHPERAVLASVFFPTELLRSAGLSPYCAEAVSGFVAAARAEQGFVAAAEQGGVAETYCSYHKALLGAAELDVLQAPVMAACCSLACDANSLTFKTLARRWGCPHAYVDVPYEADADAMAYVADQLHEVAATLADLGHPVDEGVLRDTCATSLASLRALWAALPARRADRYQANAMGQEMQAALALHLSLGTPDVRDMCEALGEEPTLPFGGVSLVWMHTTPFFQEPLQELLDANPRCQVCVSDMCYDVPDPSETPLPDPSADPFAFMAARLVHDAYGGPSRHRIERVRRLVRETGADGVVCFCQWGCKQTLGASQLIKGELEGAGIPTLVLEGDGCNRANTSNGQVATRMGAFVEMLRARKGAEGSR